MNDAKVQPSFYAIVPANVRYCKTIEPSAKLLYGEITALANQEGYCWASNKYFADLYDVDERTIKRWIQSLRDHEFIFVHIEQQGFASKRMIFISESSQKMFTKGQKCHGGGTKMSPSGGQKCPTNNTRSNTTEKQQPEAAKAAAEPKAQVVVPYFKILDKLEINDTLKLKLSAGHSEATIVSAVEKCIQWKGRLNDAAAIQTILKEGDNWKSTDSKADVTQKNIEYLRKVEKTGQMKMGDYHVAIGDDYIEFSAGIACYRYCANDVSFLDNVKTFIQKAMNSSRLKC